VQTVQTGEFVTRMSPRGTSGGRTRCVSRPGWSQKALQINLMPEAGLEPGLGPG
jgi:hypothetical protein